MEKNYNHGVYAGGSGNQNFGNNEETGLFVNANEQTNMSQQLTHQTDILADFKQALTRQNAQSKSGQVLSQFIDGIQYFDNPWARDVSFVQKPAVDAVIASAISDFTHVSVSQDGVTLVQGNRVFVIGGGAATTLTAAAYSTTAALPACTYANGTAGVGATLTGNVNGALPSQDGQTINPGDRILVQNQTAALQNGVYSVTQVGTGLLPFILTRVTDFDQSTEMVAGVEIPVTAGTLYGGKTFVLTASVTTVGTSAVTFADASTSPAAKIENGIYAVGVVSGGFAPLTRAVDMSEGSAGADVANQVRYGAYAKVKGGTTYGGKFLYVSTPNPIVLGVTGISVADMATIQPTSQIVNTPGDVGVKNSDTVMYAKA
jgi:hypothetical protein